MKIPNTDLTISDPLYNCPLCKYTSFRIGNLANHIESKHPEHFTGVHRY